MQQGSKEKVGVCVEVALWLRARGVKGVTLPDASSCSGNGLTHVNDAPNVNKEKR